MSAVEPRQRQRCRNGGFTLVEVLVALAVFSLAALALLRLQGHAILATGRIDARLHADIVAHNQLVTALVLPPTAGAGTERAGHRDWRWQRRLTPTGDPRLLRIDVMVSDDQGRTLATAAGLARVS